MKGLFLDACRRSYAACLRLLPAGFRRRHGLEMRTLFRDRLEAAARDRGSFEVIRLLVHEVIDVLKTAWSVRRPSRVTPGAVGAQTGTPGTGWTRFGARAGLNGLSTVAVGGIRQVLRSPGASMMALAVIALGIATTTSIFVLVNGVVLRPLSHRDPDSLVIIGQTDPSLGDTRVPMSWPNFVDLRAAGGTGVADMAAFRWPASLRVSAGESPEIAGVSPVTGALFGLLGNRPVLGRTIEEADEAAEAHVAVLDYRYWNTRYGADRTILGNTITIEGQAFAIVGVMGPDFEFPTPSADVFIQLREVPAMADRDTRFIGVVGRMAPGVSLGQARQRMSRAMERLVVAWPEANEGNGVRLDPLRAVVIGDSEPAMLLLLGAVVLLLLLSCASVANLLLARMAGRSGEMAVRRALGAGRGRIAAQILAEGLVLAVVGGAVGLLLSFGLTRLLLDFVPAGLPRIGTVGFDARAFVFAATATVGSGVLFGMAPAIRGSALRAGEMLRRTAVGVVGPTHQRLLRVLVAAQIALTVVLLVGAGLMVNSFVRLVTVDSGLDPDRVVTLRVGLPQDYESPGRVDGFFAELVERASAIPGVSAAGATWALPFTNDWASGRVTVEGAPRPRGEEILAGLIPVRGRYFAATGMRLVGGRAFEPADYARARATVPTSDEEPPPGESIAVINQAAARTMWPGVETVIGRRFRRGRADEESAWITVIGVVADAKRSALSEPAEPEIYRMHPEALWARDMSLVVRTDADPLTLVASLRRIVQDLDPALAVRQVGRLSDFVSRSVAEPRFRTLVVAAFAAASLVLALAGIYGVLSFAVSLRTREIGIRMALGAGRGRVLAAVLREGGLVVTAGLAVGLAMTAGGAGLVRSQLFGIGPFDLPTWLGVTVLTAASGLLACWLPATRASRVPPATAMRD